MRVNRTVTKAAAVTSIRFDVTLPVTRFGRGPFSFDPVEQLIGTSLKSILEPLMVGALHRRPSMNGTAVEVYPLALPDREGVTVPLGRFGELGLRNDGGLLVLAVPLSMAGWIRQRMGQAIQHESNEGLSLDRTARVAEFWLRLTPGQRAAIPLGMLGEVGIEAG